jgi:nucleotide-binding universal stress UspA family protein
MYTRIVVPLDGSDVAEQALAPAAEMAELVGAPLHLVRVLDVHSSDFTYMYGYMSESIDSGPIKAEQDVATQYLAETAHMLQQGDHTVTHELRYGGAPAGIVESLQPGDLLVIASHGRSGMSRWFLGSVAESVIRQSNVPVLLVRAVQSRAHRNGHRPPARTVAP